MKTDRTPIQTSRAAAKGKPPGALRLILVRDRGRALSSEIPRLALFILSACLASCASTPSAKHNFELSSGDSPAEVQERWILVSSDPPTFHPRGLAKSARLGSDHGRWITSTCPPAKWFVPRGGLGDRSEAQLLEEAFVMRITVKRARPGKAGELVGNTLASGVLLGILAGAQYGGQEVYDTIDEMWSDPDLGDTYALLSEIYAERGDTKKARKYAAKANCESPGSWDVRNKETNRIDRYPSGDYWRGELDGKLFFVERPLDFKVPTPSDGKASAFRPVGYSRVRDSAPEWLTVYSYENESMAKAPGRTWRLDYVPDPAAEKPVTAVEVFARNTVRDQALFLGTARIIPVQVNADFREEVVKLTREGLQAEEIAERHNVSLETVKMIQRHKNVDLELLRKIEKGRKER